MYVANLKQVDFSKVETLEELLGILRALDYRVYIDVNEHPRFEQFTFDEPTS